MKKLKKQTKEKLGATLLSIMMPSLDGWEGKKIPISILTVEK